MANSKISALTSATTPVAGTEVLPIVQSGSTVKVSIDNLTTGKVVPTGGVKVSSSAMSSATIGSVLEGSWPWQMWRDTEASQSSFVAYIDGGFWYVASIPYADRNSAPSGVATTRFQVRDDGNVTVNTNNLIFGTAAKGINFTANTPASGMTSQLLNWYEEGTWTPNQGAGLTLVGAFSSAGTYTRVGRQVFVQGSVSGATSVAAASAGAITSNLPFSAVADATGAAINAANTASSVLRVSSATLTAATAVAATATITFSATYSV